MEALPSSFRRRCYGAAVEAALAPIRSDRTARPSAPRLQELMSQLDADGHNTAALREELSQLLDAVAIALPGFHTRLPPDLQMVPIAAHGERQLPDDLLALRNSQGRPAPRIAIVSRSLDLDPGLPVFAGAEPPLSCHLGSSALAPVLSHRSPAA